MTYADILKAKSEIDTGPPTPKGPLMKSTKSKFGFSSEISLAASKTHVFLTWHDIKFEVPNKDGEPPIPTDAISIDRIESADNSERGSAKNESNRFGSQPFTAIGASANLSGSSG